LSLILEVILILSRETRRLVDVYPGLSVLSSLTHQL